MEQQPENEPTDDEKNVFVKLRKLDPFAWIFFGAIIAWVLWISLFSHWIRDALVPMPSNAGQVAQAPVAVATASVRFHLNHPPLLSTKKVMQQTWAGDGEISVTVPHATPPKDLDALAQLGQMGDAFGGFNALAAALAGVGVFYAARLQRATLKEVQNAERKTDAARQFDQAQGSFFEMLQLSRDLLLRVVLRGTTRRRRRRVGERSPENVVSPDVVGASAFDSIAFSINKRAAARPEDARVIEAVEHYRRYYAEQPSRIGPYFRLLFQMFKLIDRAPISGPQKLQLANIARGQLSEGTVLLLAVNALTWRGWAFVEYIEKYGLLEHMHPDHITTFRKAMKRAFSNHAFLGSNERESMPALDEGAAPDAMGFDTSEEANAERQRLASLGRKAR